MHQCAPDAYADDHDNQIEGHRRRIELASGITLNVVEWRAPQHDSRVPTLLLLHGLGDATCVWRDVAADLQTHAHVIAVDLRGHGDSDWPVDVDYQVSSMAADIGELMQRMQLPKLTLVGHSMGAAVALRVATEHPLHVERLVLADFGLDAAPESVVQLRGALRAAHRPYASVDEYAAVLRARQPLAHADLMHWVAAQTTRQSPSQHFEPKYDVRILAARDRAMGPAHPPGAYHETWQLLAALPCPVLVLRGAASSVLSAKVAKEMAAIAKDGTLCAIPLSGHSIHLDNPPAVTSAIRHFQRLPMA